MSAAISWIAPPRNLSVNIGRYGDRVIVAVMAVAEYMAQKIQSSMRQNAPWTDRTGNARSGLFSVAERAAKDVIVIWLSHGHTIEYGVWLEVANGGRYAAILPALQGNIPELERMLDQIFRG